MNHILLNQVNNILVVVMALTITILNMNRVHTATHFNKMM